MDITAIENRLQEILLPVFGLVAVDELPVNASLISDIGADSLDFVEIIYLIEKEFGIALKPGEIVSGGAKIDTDDFFVEGRLTASGLAALQNHVPDNADRFEEGMTKIDLFRSITVSDLANTIAQRKSC